mgnify:CR=1 FL=1
MQGPYAATIFHSWLILVRGTIRRAGPRGVSVLASGAWELSTLWEAWQRGGITAVHAALDEADVVVTHAGLGALAVNLTCALMLARHRTGSGSLTRAAYLSAAFVEADFAFYGTVLSGTPELKERWKRGVGLVNGVLALVAIALSSRKRIAWWIATIYLVLFMVSNALLLVDPVATDFGTNALGGGPDSRRMPNAQSPEEVAAVIHELLEHPRGDVYTRPEYHEQVLGFYGAEDQGAPPKR